MRGSGLGIHLDARRRVDEHEPVLASVGSLRRIGDRRDAGIQRRVAGELTTLDGVELGRGIVREPHVVVSDRRRQAAHADAQREPAGRALGAADLAECGRLVEQLGVEEFRVGVRHDDVGVVTGPVVEVDALDPTARCVDRDHLRTGPDDHPGPFRHTLQRLAQRVEPAACVPATEAGLDVRDAGQRGRRTERGRAGIGGVPTGPLDQSLVVEVGPRRSIERPERVDGGEVGGRTQPLGQRQRVGHRAGEERALGDVPDPSGRAGRRHATRHLHLRGSGRTTRPCRRSRRTRRVRSRHSSGTGTAGRGGRVRPRRPGSCRRLGTVRRTRAAT